MVGSGCYQFSVSQSGYRAQRMSTWRPISILQSLQRVLELVRRQESSQSIGKKLQVIREAAKHEYPVGDMAEMLADIEAGYAVASQHSER